MKRLLLNLTIKAGIKGIILPIVVFSGVFTSLQGQDRLDFGIIWQNHLYINEFNQDQKSFCLLETKMDIDSVKKTCGAFYFNSLIDFRSYGWDVKHNECVFVVIEYLTRLPSEANIGFIQKGMPAISYRIPHVGYWVRSEEMEKKQRSDIHWPAALDITVANDTVWLLHRRNRAIDLWFGKSVVEQERRDFTWEHIHTYLADSSEVAYQFSYTKNGIVPMDDHFSQESLPYSKIMAAKLKLIRQGEYFFVMNMSHGEIYHLGDKIELVGLINKENKPWKKNYGERALLIEDRDNGTLITSQSVTRLQTGGLFPKFTQMKE